MRSNYGEDLRRLLRQAFQRYFALASQRKNFCPRCTHTQLQILQRYHCQAIMGALGGWTEEDTQRLDEIVHTVYHIMTAEIPPGTARPDIIYLTKEPACKIFLHAGSILSITRKKICQLRSKAGPL